VVHEVDLPGAVVEHDCRIVHDLDLEAGLLPDLAPRRHPGLLAALDQAAGQSPPVAVGLPEQQDGAVVAPHHDHHPDREGRPPHPDQPPPDQPRRPPDQGEDTAKQPPSHAMESRGGRGRGSSFPCVRVGLVCPYSLTVPGGVQGQVLGLARALRLLGHHVRVLAPCDGPPPDAGVTPLGRSIPAAANGSVAPIAPDPACALRTIRALRDEEFDVVHLHEPFVPGACITTMLVADRPMLGTFHRAGASAAYTAVKPIVRRAARRLALRCAVSEDARRTAQDALGGDYELVFNAIDRAQYTKATPHPTDGPTIFFCGRHEPRKGLEPLLEAMAELPADVRLWVASDGPETDGLRARFASDARVEWLGRVSEAEKVDRLRGADVFCAPSLRGESFGVVLLEAMAAGTAIVASDLPGYRNVAADGVHALLVPPGEPAALAAALRRALADDDLVRRLVAAGEERAEEFDMAHLAERYVDLYERITA
jgi:phosphatidyl-myo-inositol alpha-mannosyltransferase